MTLSKRSPLVYGVLLAVWIVIVVWQIVEHSRVRQAARTELINRARDISTTLGLVLRSQRRFGVISRERIESALTSLVTPGQLHAVALLNDAGDVVASAGAPIDFEPKSLVPSSAYWAERTVTLMNLVDLGTNVTAEPDESRPTLVLSRSDMMDRFGTNRPGPPPGPPPEAQSFTNGAADPGGPEGAEARPRPRNWGRRGGEPRPPFGRPFWMSESEYKLALEKQGLHSFAVVLSTRSMHATIRQDSWLRAIIVALASVSVVGLVLSFRVLARSSELEVRLVRAAELNARLREMNLAAAGLAHETKNPLNIIRGLAQMISKQEDAGPEIRQRSRGIVEETDRVTAQLNEFINYSRPREVRRSAVVLGSVVSEVVRALGHDLEEKQVKLEVQEHLPTIEADEQLLRQALFNLLINAVQAVDFGGVIQVGVARPTAGEVTLEIRDNGPGVPPEHRTDVFKPYFTTHQKGTGLGLAVVQQIVLAHGWEIDCQANEPRGALFRIAHLRVVPG